MGGSNDLSYIKSNFPGLKDVSDVTFKDVDVHDFFQFLVSDLGLQIVADNNVQGKVRVMFKTVHPIDLLDAVGKQLGFTWRFQDGVFYVGNQLPFRVYQLDYIKVKDLQSVLTPFLIGVANTST